MVQTKAVVDVYRTGMSSSVVLGVTRRGDLSFGPRKSVVFTMMLLQSITGHAQISQLIGMCVGPGEQRLQILVCQLDCFCALLLKSSVARYFLLVLSGHSHSCNLFIHILVAELINTSGTVDSLCRLNFLESTISNVCLSQLVEVVVHASVLVLIITGVVLVVVIIIIKHTITTGTCCGGKPVQPDKTLPVALQIFIMKTPSLILLSRNLHLATKYHIIFSGKLKYT
jgi:hypothetical protein